MLNVFAIDTSLPLLERLIGSKYNIGSVIGSPLQRLVTATAINEQMYNEKGVNTLLLSELTNNPCTVTGYIEHDVVMRENVDFVSEKLAGQIAYARNEGSGVIEELAENVQATIDSFAPFSDVGAEVIERKIPDILLNQSFMEAIQESHECSRVDVKIALRMPLMNAADIRRMMRTGLPSLDDIIVQYMTELGDTGLERLWGELFSEQSPIHNQGKAGTNLSHYITGEQNIINAVFVFLLSRKLVDKILPNVNMTEADYMRCMSDYRNQAAARLCDVVANIAIDENNGRLVQSIKGLKVTVNAALYRKFLEMGGSAEAVLGSVLFPTMSVNITEMLDNKDKFETAWRRQYAFNEQTHRINRFQRIKDAFILEYAHQTKNASEKDFPTSERAVSYELFVAAVSRLTISDTDDILMTSLKLLGASRYRNRNVCEILSSMAYIVKKNNKVTPKEAASIAIIEYVARWVVSQMVISTNGRTIGSK